MIDIHLQGEYYITSDPLNFKLERRFIGKDKDGHDKESVATEGYYNTVTNVLLGYKEKVVRDSNSKTIDELLKVVRETDNVINEVLKGI